MNKTTYTYPPKPSGYTDDELAARLSNVLYHEEISKGLQEEIVRKYPERHRVKMPLASEQKLTERMMAAVEGDPRSLPNQQYFDPKKGWVFAKSEGMLQEREEMEARHAKQIPDWDKIGESQLVAMNVEPTQYQTQMPRWFTEHVEEKED